MCARIRQVASGPQHLTDQEQRLYTDLLSRSEDVLSTFDGSAGAPTREHVEDSVKEGTPVMGFDSTSFTIAALDLQYDSNASLWTMSKMTLSSRRWSTRA